MYWFSVSKFKSLESYINYDRVNKTKNTQTAGARRLFVVSSIYLPAELPTQKNMPYCSVMLKPRLFLYVSKDHAMKAYSSTSALDLGRNPAPTSLKCTLVQALRLCTGRMTHRGSRGIALPFHDHGTRRGWGVSVTPRPLFTPGKPRYPLYRRLRGPQGRSGQVRKISLPPEFDPRTIQPVASRYT